MEILLVIVIISRIFGAATAPFTKRPVDCELLCFPAEYESVSLLFLSFGASLVKLRNSLLFCLFSRISALYHIKKIRILYF